MSDIGDPFLIGTTSLKLLVEQVMIRMVIAAGAPQKGEQHFAKDPMGSFQHSSDSQFGKGIRLRNRNSIKKRGRFEIAVDPIIDVATYERFVKMRAKNKTYPARHIHHDYLIGGLLFEVVYPIAQADSC